MITFPLRCAFWVVVHFRFRFQEQVVLTSVTPDLSNTSKQRLDLAIYTVDSALGGSDPVNWSTVELSVEVKLEHVSAEDPIEHEMWFIDAYNVDFTGPVRKTRMVYAERKKLEELTVNLKEHKHVVSLFERIWAGGSGADPAELGPRPLNDMVPDQLRADFCLHS